MTEGSAAAAEPFGFAKVDAAHTVIAEKEVPGEIPRFEIPEWRERFGVLAGITGRGNAPEGFDLGLWGGIPVATAMHRWRAFRAAMPEMHAAVLGMQVHGRVVAWHTDPVGWVILDGIDGHATDRAGVLLTVTVADCVPVYLVDPVGRRAALLHAGWRGASARILEAAIGVLESSGSLRADLVMHCGVAICGACYEVGSEVFTACGLPGPPDGNRATFDLRGLLTAQARRQGVRHISTSTYCSAHGAESFFSHRASGGADGRMVAYLGLLA